MLLLLCWCVVSAVQAQEDPSDLLQRFRKKLTETVGRLPRYTCTQTIDRAQYEPETKRGTHSCEELIAQAANGRSKPRLATSDRLRLDVAVAGGREMYSWVGENRFDDRGLTDLVADGAISSGSFAAFLMSIFSGDAATFSYSGKKSVDSRQLMEYAFEVPLAKSHYSFGGRSRRGVITAYGGAFLVDPTDLGLVRLAVRTNGLPPETGSCEAATTLEYGHARLNAADFLLPTEVRLEIIDASGAESVNRTVFSQCHEFVGESTVKFDPAPEAVAAAARDGPVKRASSLSLPEGISFKVALAQQIHTATAAAGDPIRARLAGAIRGHGSEVLAPSGAEVTGRLVEVRRYYQPVPFLLIRFKLETVNIGGTVHPLTAHAVAMDLRLASIRGTRSPTLPREYVGVLKSPEDPAAAAFVFRNVQQNYVVSGGLESDWVTAAPER